MATDSTELTFVRCPSCRSLVPAVSTRCRMCGATLDAAAASDEADKEKKSGRVRQRTMSAPDSELSAAASQVREDAPPPPPPPPPAPERATPAIEAHEEDDPLGDYLDAIDEVPAVKASPAPAAMKPMAPPPPPPPQPQRSAPPPQRTAPPPVESKPVASADIDLDDELDVETELPAEGSPGPKVIVESGGRRSFSQGKPGGLSFSRPREEPQKPAARPTPPPPPPQPKAPPVAERPEPAQREAQQKRSEPRPEPRREERPREMTSQPPPSRPAPQPQRAVEPPRRAEAASGRLYGWLVSYADPDGKSIELREGKFFVTGSSLKESDLVINDKSISTPHALVSIGGDGGLRLQDLMSDRGVFLRHGESGAYQRREEPCTVEHGDWVRFGDVEFLVCLIAHVGVR